MYKLWQVSQIGPSRGARLLSAVCADARVGVKPLADDMFAKSDRPFISGLSHVRDDLWTRSKRLISLPLSLALPPVVPGGRYAGRRPPDVRGRRVALIRRPSMVAVKTQTVALLIKSASILLNCCQYLNRINSTLDRPVKIQIMIGDRHEANQPFRVNVC
jgi:hypothetical protein